METVAVMFNETGNDTNTIENSVTDSVIVLDKAISLDTINDIITENGGAPTEPRNWEISDSDWRCACSQLERTCCSKCRIVRPALPAGYDIREGSYTCPTCGHRVNWY